MRYKMVLKVGRTYLEKKSHYLFGHGLVTVCARAVYWVHVIRVVNFLTDNARACLGGLCLHTLN